MTYIMPSMPLVLKLFLTHLILMVLYFGYTSIIEDKPERGILIGSSLGIWLIYFIYLVWSL